MSEGRLFPSSNGHPVAVVGLRRALLCALAVGMVVGLDVVLSTTSAPRAVRALLDEPAHLVTAGLLLVAAAGLRGRPHPRWLLVSALAMSVLIDVDHVPMDLFGSDVLTAGTRRPYSHSVTTPLVLAAVAALLPRGRARLVAAGAAVGVLLHVWRDLATGGASLSWPLSTVNVTVPYWLYAASLVVAAVVAARRR